MRKTSHDGGDSTSITSGAESEIRKSVMKPKKSSLKRKTPNFSHESDDTVIEPLLQKDKGKTETNQSAKYFTKPKTDFMHEENSDTAKLLNDNKVQATTTTGFCGTTESLLSMKECDVPKATSGVAVPIHNYMNTNVFNTHDNSKANLIAKTQILVEIDGSKQSGYNPSPLIFTTAKIHTDAKSKHMEPVQMTPVPILSTTEVTMAMDGSFTTNEKKISNGSSVMNPVCSQVSLDLDKEQRSTVSNSNTVRLPTAISKDSFGKSNAITSAVNLSNNTSVSNSIENNLPPTTSKTVSMISNTNNQYQKQETPRDNKIDQPVPKTISPQLKSFALDKNNVTVKTSVIGNVSIKSAKSGHGDTSDKAQINKLVANSDNKTSTDLSSNDNLHSVNIKLPTTSKNSIEVSNTKKICSSGNKQLQRQKTITDDKSIIESNTKPDTEQREALNAKTTPVYNKPSQSRAIASTSIKNFDILSELSANNAQNTVAKLTSNTTANITTNVSSISMYAKPTNTCVNSSSSITSNISSIPSNTDTIVQLAESSTNVPSYKSSSKPAVAPITVSMTVTKSPATSVAKTSSIPTSIKSVKLPDGNSVHHTTSVGKTTLAKSPSLTTSIAHTTTSVSSVSSKSVTVPTTKPSPIVISASIATNNIIDNSKSKTSVAKSPSVTTPTKPTSVRTSTNIKPSPTAGQVVTNTKLSTASAQSGSAKKAPTITTSIPTIPVSTIPSKTTIAQNTTSDQISANKQTTKTFGVSAITKKPSSTTSAKPAMAFSTTSNTTSAKTPTESSSISTTTKPSTTPTTKSIPLVTTSAKRTTVSPSTSLASPFVAKSIEATPSATIKESTSTKKPIVTTKSSSTHTPPVSSACAVEGTISKTPSTSTFSMTSTKSATTTNKSVPVKTPTVTTSTKMPLTSANATTSVTSTKTNTMNPTQICSNTSVGIVGKSVASSTPVLRDSELVKKGGTKSCESKDGKDTKA